MMRSNVNGSTNPAPEIEERGTDSAAVPTSEKLVCAALCAVLGGLLVFGAGFTSDIRLHNAAHDARHVAGFPCN